MTDAVRTTTLLELIARAAFRLDDFVELVATEAKTDMSFMDVINIPTGSESLDRRQIVFVTGDNQYHQAVVTNTNQSSHTINFSPKVSTGTTDAGDTLYVFNKRGMGFAINEYIRAAKMAQDDAYPLYRPIIEGTAATFSSTSPLLTIPSTIDEVFAVVWEHPNGDWHYLNQAQQDGWNGWFSRPYDGEVVISGPERNIAHGRSVKVIGYGRETPFTTSLASTTKIHPEWMVARMCYHLCLLGLNRDGTGGTGLRAKQVLTFQQEANAMLEKIRTMHHPMSVRSRG